MRVEVIRGINPTQRRWLPIGRCHDGCGHLQGFTVCWWTGMVVVLLHRGKRPRQPMPQAPMFHHEVRTVMTDDGPLPVHVPVLDQPLPDYVMAPPTPGYTEQPRGGLTYAQLLEPFKCGACHGEPPHGFTCNTCGKTGER